MSDWVATISSPRGALLVAAILALTYVGLRIGRMDSVATMTLASGLVCGFIPMGWVVLVCAFLPLVAPLILMFAAFISLVSPESLIFNTELAALGALLAALISGIGYAMGRL